MPETEKAPVPLHAIPPALRRLSAPDLSPADPDCAGRIAVYAFPVTDGPDTPLPDEPDMPAASPDRLPDLRPQLERLCRELSQDGPFASPETLRSFCRAHPEAILPDGNLFALRADTDRYSILFRFTPNADPPRVTAVAYDAGAVESAGSRNDPRLITCVSVCPGRPAFVTEIPPDLHILQREVGGDVEVFYPFPSPDIAVLCNEEGKIRGLPLCRSIRDDSGAITDIVAGRFLICGVRDGQFVSLGDEDLRTALDSFFAPEEFFLSGGEIGARPVPPVFDAVPCADPVPLYRRTYREALERGEADACERSFRANIACRDAIEQTLSEGTRNGVLRASGTREILDRFGEERTAFVLANTLQKHSRDSRYSVSNRAWGASVPVPDDRNAFGADRNLYFMIDRCNARLADVFVTQTRRILAQRAFDRDPGRMEAEHPALPVRQRSAARGEAER